MAITSANQLELLQTAEAVAREKMIDPGLVVDAMEESLARAAKSRYGSEMDIRVSIDRKTGKATFTRVRTVVEQHRDDARVAERRVADAVRVVEPAQGVQEPAHRGQAVAEPRRAHARHCAPRVARDLS